MNQWFFDFGSFGQSVGKLLGKKFALNLLGLLDLWGFGGLVRFLEIEARDWRLVAMSLSLRGLGRTRTEPLLLGEIIGFGGMGGVGVGISLVDLVLRLPRRPLYLKKSLVDSRIVLGRRGGLVLMALPISQTSFEYSRWEMVDLFPRVWGFSVGRVESLFSPGA